MNAEDSDAPQSRQIDRVRAIARYHPDWFAEDVSMRRFRIALLFTCCLAGSVCAKGLAVGEPAPAIEATLLDGSHFSLADARGKVVVLNVWATWCGPCRAEMPALETFYQAHAKDGLVVLAISADDRADIDKVRQVMQEFTYPAAMAHDAKFGGYGRLWRVPLTFVIDRDGVLRRDGFKATPTIDASVLDKDVLPLLQH
jgi:cytochrome c biogenesis protein CcmG, thiol:disulfide interchange protein DsbE